MLDEAVCDLAVLKTDAEGRVYDPATGEGVEFEMVGEAALGGTFDIAAMVGEPATPRPTVRPEKVGGR